MVKKKIVKAETNNRGKLKKGVWSRKYAKCLGCGKKKNPHVQHGYCTECWPKYRYETNKDKFKKYYSKYYENNIESIKETRRKYYQKNKEKLLTNAKKKRLKNKAKK